MHSNKVGAGQKNFSPGNGFVAFQGDSSNIEGPGFEYLGLCGYMQQLVGYTPFGRVHEDSLTS